MSKRIVLCDDEIHIVRAAELKLSRAGYDVVCAHDGDSAWELIQEEVPALLITDCQMPRCDGFELCRRIREDSSLSGLPVFMLTAKGFELSQTEVAAKWGVRQLIAKPFSPRELLKTVDEVLSEASVSVGASS